MKLRDAYRQKIEAQIEELNARLAVARAQAKRLAADAKIVAYEEFAETDRKLDELKVKLTQLGTSGEGAWTDLKGGVEAAWGELSDAAKAATGRFATKTPDSNPR